MAITDADGDVVNTYGYDVFGSVRSQTGSQPNEFRFTGEQRDSESGFYYLRARYYDPAIGRFVSQDPIMGSAIGPQTLNRYPYVLNNPCSLIDPWGLQYEGSCRPPTPTPSTAPSPTSGLSAPRLLGEKLGPSTTATRTPFGTPTPTGTRTPTPVPSGTATPTGTPTPTAADPCAPKPYAPGHDFALFPAIKELLVRSSGWFTSTCPGQVTRGATGILVSGVGVGGATTPGFQWLSPLIPAGYEIGFGGPPGEPPLEACY